MSKIQFIFIHHSAVSYGKNPDQWKATDNYHKAKGWGGGGYNYEVAKNGSIHQFRPDGTPTAAQYQENMNDGRALSICLDGNFDIELPTEQQKLAVATWLKDKMERYNIPKGNVFCHRKVAPKSCPGKLLPDNIYSYFIKEEVPEWAANAAQKALNKGIILDYSNLDKALTVQEIEEVLVKNKIFQKTEGSITMVRLLVALERLKSL